MTMLTIWSRIGGAVLLVFVLGLLTKGVADVAELKGTVNTVVSRVDTLQAQMSSLETEMNGRFVQMENRFLQLENRMETRLVRIENLLMGRAPDANDVAAPASATAERRPIENPG